MQDRNLYKGICCGVYIAGGLHNSKARLFVELGYKLADIL